MSDNTSTPVTEEQLRGRTAADAEIERAIQKGKSGNVLDPIALDDPTGKGVEKVIAHVGLTVFIILVAGILLAQVACKSIRLSTIPDFAADGANEQTVEQALRHGAVWADAIVRYPDVELSSVHSGVVEVVENVRGTASLEELLSGAIERSTALAASVLSDPEAQELRYVVRAHVVPSVDASEATPTDETPVAFTLAWQRNADDHGFDVSIIGNALQVLETPKTQVTQ